MNLDHIYRLYMKEIYLYLYRLTRNEKQAEELTQDTFTRAYLYLDDYQGEKVRPWLFKVAYHAFVDWHRKHRAQIPMDPVVLQEMVEHADDRGSPEKQLLEKEEWQTFLKLLDLLSEKQKQVLLLRYKHHFTYAEIGEVLDVTAADVKITVYRGRQKLQVIWKERMNK
ncbi:sigma-70 family RNA polymerase sigma factor [Brevibacillus fluminis]|uniref:sigma-70 family RNA polymerase sigma factor n=1 Tax=Brevibacillus fluminis TaxID=511487 RepID=UPI001FE30780|nr:sigma-70 family RNA polymerase sigma factor [Brevibacillus fluminis]